MSGGVWVAPATDTTCARSAGGSAFSGSGSGSGGPGSRGDAPRSPMADVVLMAGVLSGSGALASTRTVRRISRTRPCGNHCDSPVRPTRRAASRTSTCRAHVAGSSSAIAQA